MGIEVIIPTYRPDHTFEILLERLTRQSVAPDKIHIWNTEEKYWNTEWEKKYPDLEVHHIARSEFDHGGTRHQAADLVTGDYFVCMTQDAVPADTHLLERLVRMLEQDQRIGACCARQLPRRDASPEEKLTRSFNYPEESRVRFEKDRERYGVKTYFCSNVCALYRRSAYEEAGGFEMRTIFNEDMILCGKMLKKGYGAGYCAEARVIHSHNYTCLQQFHRNFDLGVSQAMYPEIFGMVSSEKEGGNLVKMVCRELFHSKKGYRIPGFLINGMFRYAGYFLGKHYRQLPQSMCRMLSMNKAWWGK